MDLSRIEKLLERYWDCTTTVEEEEELRAFFNGKTGNDLPDRFKEAANLFRYFELQRLATLDNKFEDETITKLNTQKTPAGRSFKHNFKSYLQVAAVLAGIVTASIIFRMEFWESDKSKMLVEDTFQTPEEAYEETKKAFLLIAEKMNSGRVQAQKLGALNEAEEKIKKEEK